MTVTVTNRKGLQNAACDCYRMIKRRYDELLPGTFEG